MKTCLIAIDMGNTRTKFARFDSRGDIAELHIWDAARMEEGLTQWVKQQDTDTALSMAWISTANPFDLTHAACWQHFTSPPHFVPIHSATELPIQTRYSTPETLGIDRITGIIAACNVSKGNAVMVIDMGTAITYDFADKEGVYCGGGISPGVNMRFRALHTFTARLPLVKAETFPPLVGDSTYASISSGVINGVSSEINETIRQYKTEYGEDLKVFLTGGDAPFFENHLKNINFADSNLILKGIYYILTHKSPL